MKFLFYLIQTTCVSSFLLGSWKLVHKNYPIFRVSEKKIESISENGCLSMKLKSLTHFPNHTMEINLYDLRVEKRPTDWYNFTKYSTIIELFNLISKQGITLYVTTHTNDTLCVCCHLPGKRNQSRFLLERHEIC